MENLTGIFIMVLQLRGLMHMQAGYQVTTKERDTIDTGFQVTGREKESKAY
jgi:hypothetical protein|tara:strand:- start:2732 stop:2884 length:153 start_codon:yes stop_codon:yes gene_type:complete